MRKKSKINAHTYTHFFNKPVYQIRVNIYMQFGDTAIANSRESSVCVCALYVSFSPFRLSFLFFVHFFLSLCLCVFGMYILLYYIHTLYFILAPNLSVYMCVCVWCCQTFRICFHFTLFASDS